MTEGEKKKKKDGGRTDNRDGGKGKSSRSEEGAVRERREKCRRSV